MIVVSLLLSLLLVIFCLRASPSRSEEQQAALLPFADDPAAARRLEHETGLRCDRLVEIPGEPLAQPRGFRLDA